MIEFEWNVNAVECIWLRCLWWWCRWRRKKTKREKDKEWKYIENYCRLNTYESQAVNLSYFPKSTIISIKNSIKLVTAFSKLRRSFSCTFDVASSAFIFICKWLCDCMSSTRYCFQLRYKMNSKNVHSKLLKSHFLKRGKPFTYLKCCLIFRGEPISHQKNMMNFSRMTCHRRHLATSFPLV